MEITPVKKTRLNDEVFQQMKQLLAGGVWKPGERIPSEHELSDRFGVSRITIRQALQNLTSIGLIETRPGKGRFVCNPEVGQLMQQLSPVLYLDNFSVMQVNEFREMLDVWSAKLAAQRAEEADVEKLRRNHAAMELAARDEDWERFADLDLEFHMQVGEITRNTLIVHTYAILYDTLHTSMVQIVDKMKGTALDYHRRLIEAIAEHNVSRAEDVSRKHLELNRRFIQLYFDCQ